MATDEQKPGPSQSSAASMLPSRHPHLRDTAVFLASSSASQR
jgi:hypothetical protein